MKPEAEIKAAIYKLEAENKDTLTGKRVTVKANPSLALNQISMEAQLKALYWALDKVWKSKLVLLTLFFLPACSTTLYENGKPIARVQSDAQNFAYNRTGDGAVSLTVGVLSNSAPIAAVGRIITPAIVAAGTAYAVGQSTEVVKAIRLPVR